MVDTNQGRQGEYEERKRKNIASFVKDGMVDWKRWNDLEGSDGGTSYNDEIKRGVISYLLELGILSYSAEGNHRVAAEGLNLNPSLGGVNEIYFTQRECAKEYAKSCFRNAHYGIRVERIVEVERV